LLLCCGLALAGPAADVTPANGYFNNVEVQTSQIFVQTFTVQNVGGEDLVLGALSITGDDASCFSMSNDTCSNATLAQAETATVDIRFTPGTIGAKTATLSIPSNVDTVDVPLTGSGIFMGVLAMSDSDRIWASYSNLDGTFWPLVDIGVDIGEYCRAIELGATTTLSPVPEIIQHRQPTTSSETTATARSPTPEPYSRFGSEVSGRWTSARAISTTTATST